jgi:hypothetical protein
MRRRLFLMTYKEESDNRGAIIPADGNLLTLKSAQELQSSIHVILMKIAVKLIAGPTK